MLLEIEQLTLTLIIDFILNFLSKLFVALVSFLTFNTIFFILKIMLLLLFFIIISIFILDAGVAEALKVVYANVH